MNVKEEGTYDRSFDEDSDGTIVGIMDGVINIIFEGYLLGEIDGITSFGSKDRAKLGMFVRIGDGDGEEDVTFEGATVG